MTVYSVNHVTTYAYAAPVRLGEHRMMLRPRDSNDQRLLEAGLDIDPPPKTLRWIHDVFDNCVAVATFAGETRKLRVENRIALEHTPFEGKEFLLDESARFYPFAYDAEEIPDLTRSIERHFPDPSGELDRWVRRFLRPGRTTETGELLMTLTYAIKEGFYYERRAEKGTQTALETLARRRGSCRDFATLMMEAARTLGFAAQFVSGYLYVPDSDAQDRYLGGGSTHAWLQIYLPAPAGSNSIRPTASSAIAISFAWRSRARPGRPSRFTAAISPTTPPTARWTWRSAFAGCPRANCRVRHIWTSGNREPERPRHVQQAPFAHERVLGA